MSIWGWFKRVKMQEPEQETQPDNMVGEPVISFINSLWRTPVRYKLSKVVAQDLWRDNIKYQHHQWMNMDTFWKLVDSKTGTVYYAYRHNDKLYSVFDLPFNLNGWELSAINSAFISYRGKARSRKHRMEISHISRLREAEREQEKTARMQFAEQFK